MAPFTDIVIPYRSNREFPVEAEFTNCVETVTRHTTDFRFLFVDDNSDSVGAAHISDIAAHFPTSLLITTHSQNWFTKATNKGLRLVRTPRGVTLNCDTIVDAGWLDEMYEVWDDVEQQTGKPVGLVGSVLSDEEPRRWRCTEPPHFVTGHCWLLSMNAINKVSELRGQPGWYLDEINPLCIHIRSDVELSHRLNLMGYQTVESFKSKVGHLGGRSWGHRLGSIPSTLACDS